MQACKQWWLPSGHFLIKEVYKTALKAFLNGRDVSPDPKNGFDRLIYHLSLLLVKNSGSADLNVTGRLFIQVPFMFSKCCLLAAFQISNICETFHLAKILVLLPFF